MRKQKINRWQFIVVSDDNKNEIKRYELDDNEKLKEKMQRSKKRSLTNPMLKIKDKLDDQNTNPDPSPVKKKFDFCHQSIFSYQDPSCILGNINSPILIAPMLPNNCSCNKALTININEPFINDSENTQKKQEK